MFALGSVVWSFVTSPLGKWILGIVGVLLFLAGLYHHVWHNGYVAAEAKYEPEIAQLNSNLSQAKVNIDGLKKTIDTQNLSVTRLADVAAKARKNAALASKQADDDAVFYAERLKGLKQNLEHPSGDPNADTDRILRALALDRRMHAN